MELLIVDDETIAIQGISMVLNWEEFGIDTVWTATSVEEARAILCEEHVDFVLCDIEMRSENGLHLIDWVNQNYPAIQCIIVTGHVNFEYTRKVLELKVIDYLNKPLLERPLREAMQKAVRKRKEWYRDREMQQENQISIERHFFRTLLRENNIRSREELREEIVKRRISMPIDSEYYMLYVKIRKWNDEYTEEDKERVGFNISNLLMQVYLKNYHTYAQKISLNASLICFVPGHAEGFQEKIVKAVNRFTDYCKLYFLCEVCVYIREPVYIEQFAGELKKLQKYDEENLLYNQGACLAEARKRKRPGMVYPDYKIWRLLMENASFEELRKSVANYMDSEYFSEHVTPERLARLIKDFEYMLAAVKTDKGFSGKEDTEGRKAEEILRQDADKSVSQCRDWIFACVEEMERENTEREEKQDAAEVICRYIDSHMDEEISRNTLAGLVFMSPDHMTRVFKKAKGVTISDYILDKKMEHAAKLLVHTNFSVSYIASDVGYSNISHFSGAFKKKYDITPSEYRKLYGRMSD